MSARCITCNPPSWTSLSLIPISTLIPIPTVILIPTPTLTSIPIPTPPFFVLKHNNNQQNIALNFTLRVHLEVRKVRQLRVLLLVRLYHVILQVSQLVRVRTMHHRRSLLRVVEFGRQAVVDQASAMRVHSVRVRVVRVVNVASRAVLRVRRVHNQLLVILRRLLRVQVRRLRVTPLSRSYLRQIAAHLADLLLLGGRKRAHLASRNSCPDFAAAHRLTRSDHGTGGDRSTLADVNSVENGDAFADQTVVVDRAGVDDGAVA